MMRSPANPSCISRMVVLALNNILRAAVVESEDFIIQIEAVGIDFEAARQSVTRLSIELKVSVEIAVSRRTSRTINLRIGNGRLLSVNDNRVPAIVVCIRQVLVLVSVDHLVIEGHAHPH